MLFGGIKNKADGAAVTHVIPNWRVTPSPVPAQTLRKSSDTAG